MATIIPGPPGTEHVVLPDGTVLKLGLKPETLLMKALPKYVTEAAPVIPEKDWPRKGGGLRDFFPFDWDQNPQSSCGGHGSTISFNAAWNFAGQVRHEFSPDYTYSLCNGGQDNGSVPDDLLKALTQTGTCLRSTVGHGQIFRNSYDAAKADAEAKRFKADAVLTFTTFEELATAMLRRQGVYTGVFCDTNYMTPDAKGRLHKGGRNVGGHCTSQIGELEFMDDLQEWGAWTRGSWGKRFGQDGWYWTPRSYFDEGLRSFTGCVVVSAQRDPQDAVTPAVAAS